MTGTVIHDVPPVTTLMIAVRKNKAISIKSADMVPRAILWQKNWLHRQDLPILTIAQGIEGRRTSTPMTPPPWKKHAFFLKCSRTGMESPEVNRPFPRGLMTPTRRSRR